MRKFSNLIYSILLDVFSGLDGLMNQATTTANTQNPAARQSTPTDGATGTNPAPNLFGGQNPQQLLQLLGQLVSSLCEITLSSIIFRAVLVD